MQLRLLLDVAILSRYLRSYLDDLRRLHFSSAVPAADEIADTTAAKVASWWDRCGVNISDEEGHRAKHDLASDTDFLIDVFVHCFHDAANVFRRELHETDQKAVPSAVWDLTWDFGVQREWCRVAIEAGVIREVQFFDQPIG